MINRSPRASLLAYVTAFLVIAVCVLVLWRIPVITPGAAAPVLLLAILLIARAAGTGPALLASSAASLGFSYFFLHPVGFGIEDPNDWVAFSTFTVTAIVVGELAARAERRQLETEKGRREIESLYQQLGAAFERASEAEAARRNEQLKAALLDALTHNLRTPLTSIKASVTALLGADGGPHATSLSEEGRSELLHVIDEETDRLNRFVEALSASDRTDRSEPVSARTANLQGMVAEAVARAETVTRHHQVHVALDDDLPRLSVDRAAVIEVIYILLDNASKYSPLGTAIAIGGRQENEHSVRIWVSDRGPGIPASLREQVFEKFFRIPGREPGDSRRTSVGLGLPIARRLVEAQAGRIWIDQSPAESGTTVVMTLPAAAEDGAREPAAPVAAA